MDLSSNKKNLIEILANMLLYTSGKTKKRVLKKIVKNVEVIESFTKRLKMLKKKEAGKINGAFLMIEEDTLQEEVNICLILLESKTSKSSLKISIGNDLCI